MSDRRMLEHLALRGLYVIGCVGVLAIVALTVWHIFTPPSTAIQTIHEGQQGNWGYAQTVNVILKDGIEVRCIMLGEGSTSQAISCDWGNATKVPS